MTITQEAIKGREELANLIDKSLKKVKGAKENDLCKYLPGASGGYMHHFTLRKMKNSSPHELSSLLKQFILEATTPNALDPKPRAPRGSRKRRDIVSFTRDDIERILELARRVGDKDLVAKFSPKRSLTSLRRELIRSIRDGRVEHDLWNAYVEVSAANQAFSQAE